MEMITLNKTELIGSPLDYAVGKSVKQEMFIGRDQIYVGPNIWSPLTNWYQLGLLIDRYNIEIERVTDIDGIFLYYDCRVGAGVASGPTIPIAICRAIVDHELGFECEIPKILIHN